MNEGLTDEQAELNRISHLVIGAAMKVHRELGPGLLESAYEACLAYELADLKVPYERQKGLPVIYRGVNLDCGYRLDLLVAEKVIVELKAVERIDKVHQAQLTSYLKLSKCKLGLLINFNVVMLKDGIKRIVNGF